MPVDTPAPIAPSRSVRLLTLVVGGLSIALLGFALGRIEPTMAASPSGVADHTHPPGSMPHEHPTGTAALPVADAGGLAVSVAGYTLAAGSTTLPAGRSQDFRFRVQKPDRQPATAFAVVHDKPMHFVVARRDLTGYQHLHPTMAPDGTWSVPITLPAPGVWRAYADFTIVDAAGRQLPLTLGVDLVAAGDYTPRPLPPAATSATVDGFIVTYQGDPQAGTTQPVLFRVARDGRPVTDPQPYLGAYGHLVALREGDLGYVHVHPDPQLSGGAVKFWLGAPSPGRYRLFFDFQVAGTVHTAEFTLAVP